jgi:hypothetical protein
LEEDISNINILAEIKENNKNILSEEDILDINILVEIKKQQEKEHRDMVSIAFQVFGCNSKGSGGNRIVKRRGRKTIK